MHHARHASRAGCSPLFSHFTRANTISAKKGGLWIVVEFDYITADSAKFHNCSVIIVFISIFALKVANYFWEETKLMKVNFNNNQVVSADFACLRQSNKHRLNWLHLKSLKRRFSFKKMFSFSLILAKLKHLLTVYHCLKLQKLFSRLSQVVFFKIEI